MTEQLYTALKRLVDLKDLKDREGKSGYYETHQPAAWEQARKALAQYKSQPRSLQGGLESINFLELARKEGLQWSELNSKWFIKGTFEYRTEEQLYELFKQEAQSPEHKLDREPERKDNFNTDLLNKCTK